MSTLPDGKLRVRAAKTEAGERVVQLRPVLHEELRAYRPEVGETSADDLVFGTTTVGRQSETNVRRRILAPAVELANARLTEDGVEPLPERLTPHGLRHTFASILAALGEPMPAVIRQMGHTDPALTLRVYAHDMDRTNGERQRLRALVDGREWARSGTSGSVAGEAVKLSPVA